MAAPAEASLIGLGGEFEVLPADSIAAEDEVGVRAGPMQPPGGGEEGRVVLLGVKAGDEANQGAGAGIPSSRRRVGPAAGSGRNAPRSKPLGMTSMRSAA